MSKIKKNDVLIRARHVLNPTNDKNTSIIPSSYSELIANALQNDKCISLDWIFDNKKFLSKSDINLKDS